MNNLNQLSEQILEAKHNEQLAMEWRRKLEDEMVSLLGVSENDEGVHNFAPDEGRYKITVTCKINRTVDGDKLQELAKEAGLFDHLQRLFRWKPSIDMKAWKAADAAITAPLASAITAKAGRPAIKIDIIEEK